MRSAQMASPPRGDSAALAGQTFEAHADVASDARQPLLRAASSISAHQSFERLPRSGVASDLSGGNSEAKGSGNGRASVNNGSRRARPKRWRCEVCRRVNDCSRSLCEQCAKPQHQGYYRLAVDGGVAGTKATPVLCRRAQADLAALLLMCPGYASCVRRRDQPQHENAQQVRVRCVRPGLRLRLVTWCLPGG